MINCQVMVAEVGDEKEVAKCNKQVLPVCYPPWQFLKFIQHPHYIVLKGMVDGEVVGYIVGRVENLKRFHITTLGVYPQFRKMGIGRQLMDGLRQQVSQTFPGIRYLTLYVQTINIDGIGFYERLGMKQIQWMEDYYGPGDHGFTFGLVLESDTVESFD